MTENTPKTSRSILRWLSSITTNVTANAIGGLIVVFITAYLVTNNSGDQGGGIHDTIKPPPVVSIKLSISGTSLEDLRAKIRDESSEKMWNRNYFPANVSIDINKLTFRCNLVEKKSDYTKIVLVFSPVNASCESCKKVLEKNPGSLVLVETSVSQRIYNVIAVRE